MPRVPQIEAELSARTGPSSAYADANDFYDPSGFRAISAGIGDLASGASAVAVRQQQITEKKKLDDEYKFINDASHQYTLEATKFQEHKDNKHAEDFDARSLTFLTEQKDKYLANAPSQRARNRLEAQLNDQIERRYQMAHNVTERTRLNNGILGIDKGMAQVLTAFREDAANGPEYAVANLEASRKLLAESIDARYEPDVAKKLHDSLTARIVMGSAETAPDYARQVLKGASLDEEDYQKLTAFIDRAETAGMGLAQDHFKFMMNESLARAAENNAPLPPVRQGAWTELFGKEQGEQLAADFERKRQSVNQLHDGFQKMSGLNSEAIDRELVKAAKNPNVTSTARDGLRSRAIKLKELQGKDPSGYLSSYNDEARMAFAAFSDAAGADKANAFQRYASVALKYQGYAPKGAPDADNYLGLPTNLRGIMPQSMAMQYTAQMNHGGPDEKMQAMLEFGNLFQNYEQWAVGFNDLVVRPPESERVKPEYQLALNFMRWRDGKAYFDNGDVVKQYLGAVDNQELLKEIGKNSDKESDYNQRILSNQQFQSWAQSVYGDGWQRASQVAAAKKGIVAYAWAKGGPPSTAVKDAIDTLIGSHQYTGTVNGKLLTISRAKKDGTTRTEAESEDIMRRLAVAPKYLDTQQVDTSFLASRIKQVGEYAPEKQRLFTLRMLLSEGWFQPEHDGNAATLYLTSDNGVPFQLRDKSGKPFRIHYDNLPGFLRSKPYAGLPFESGETVGMAEERFVPEKPGMNVNEYPTPEWVDDEFTNWPLRSWKVENLRELDPSPSAIKDATIKAQMQGFVPP